MLKWQSKMDDPDKLTIREHKKNKAKTKHNTQKTNTNNVIKTWDLLQTTGGKDEPNIVFMRKS
jgi:hypothetical protein